jgi:hypothetical protein
MVALATPHAYTRLGSVIIRRKALRSNVGLLSKGNLRVLDSGPILFFRSRTHLITDTNHDRLGAAIRALSVVVAGGHCGLVRSK